MAGAGHLARRFVGSLRPGGPPAAEVAWVAAVLSPAELDLWRSMSGPDRRHSVEVARRVQVALGDEATPPVLAAALLHDVGKTVPRLGTFGRVIATLSEAVAGQDTGRHWVETSGFTRRVGQYVLYPELGVDLLKMAGSDDLVVAWSREHHLPEAEWTVDPELGRVLQAADDAS